MTETTRDPNPKPKRVKILFFACLYNLKILWVKQTQRARKKTFPSCVRWAERSAIRDHWCETPGKPGKQGRFGIEAENKWYLTMNEPY